MAPSLLPSYGSIAGDDCVAGEAVDGARGRRDSAASPRALCWIATAAVSAFFLLRCGGANHLGDRRPAMLGSMRNRSPSPADAVPFPGVDRSKFGSVAAGDIVDGELFDEALRGSGDGAGLLLAQPFPTGAFWTNLVLKAATADVGGPSYPVMAYPYGYRWSPDVLQVSYPPLRRLTDAISVRDIFNPDLTIGSVEAVGRRHVTSFDPLSVTLRWHGAGGGRWWETYLVQGSPYVTVAFRGATPTIRALSTFRAFDCLEGDGACEVLEEDRTAAVRRGARFRIRTRENLVWMVLASAPLSLRYDALRKTTVSGTEAYSGVLRLVLLPPPLDYDAPASTFPASYPGVDASSNSSAVRRLLRHADTYPVGGAVAWTAQADNAATVELRFRTRAMATDADAASTNSSGPGHDLLMLALPHHARVLPASGALLSKGEFDVAFRSIKGVMVPVVGDKWSYEEPLTTIGFESDSTLQNAASLDEATRSTILDQVRLDMTRVLPTLDENVYGFGKQIARLAQLSHIAAVLASDVSEDSLAVQIGKVLHRLLTSFLSGDSTDRLLYDTNFGGIVSQNGLRDSMDDFGNGWYNDHLFHYGYILYASAVLGRLNSTFVTEFGPAVDALFLDVANSADPSQADASSATIEDLFPFTRHKSWYDGHSFASGLFPFADGKSMESSTESVNCYYGAYLWSTVRWEGRPERIDFARLLLATEIRGVKTYWHMTAPDDEPDASPVAGLYNPHFAKNLMVGNSGMMDVTVATWFGTKPLYVHMINFMPITAITKELFDKSYVAKEFQEVIAPLYDFVEMAWKGYAVCDRALVDPTTAWKDALDLRSFELDQAISKSQVLYFTSTMDGFESPNNISPSAGGTQEAGQQQASDSAADGGSTSLSASCEQNKGCAELGLTGNCCPSSQGILLGCCSLQMQPPTASTSAPTTYSNEASCTHNEACLDLGLVGSCCPTPSGQYLGCCH